MKLLGNYAYRFHSILLFSTIQFVIIFDTNFRVAKSTILNHLGRFIFENFLHHQCIRICCVENKISKNAVTVRRKVNWKMTSDSSIAAQALCATLALVKAPTQRRTQRLKQSGVRASLSNSSANWFRIIVVRAAASTSRKCQFVYISCVRAI